MDTRKKKEYNDLVKNIGQKSNLFSDCIIAFVSGGLICVLGEFITKTFENMEFSEADSAMICSIILIGIAILLTGLGLFSKIGKYCGAGSSVPVTGFANSVASPAIEFKKEGLVFGTGARMFSVAGPVIVYGVLTSFVLGFIYWIVT